MPSRKAEQAGPVSKAGVTEQLAAALASRPGVNRYVVAFSGGMDSGVMLHALSGMRETQPGMALHAVHVHHGLHPDADSWTRHCVAYCAALQVPLEVYFARIAPQAGASPEAQARQARYHLIMQCMQPNDAVLMAHHADDQLETLLMRMLRGAGARGLGGIPEVRRLHDGWLIRPLLNLPRCEIAAYARRHKLDFLDDPSNSDQRFDRGYLRQQVIAPLRARWPAAAASAARSARHLAASAQLLAELAELDLERARTNDNGIKLSAMARLSKARRDNLLRHWILKSGFPLPSSVRLSAITADVLSAKADAQPLVRWQGAELRRYRNRVYLMRPLAEPPADWQSAWDMAGALALPANSGRLRTLSVAEGGMDAGLLEVASASVRFRRGGERLRLPGSARHKKLSKLFQELGVVPWMRARVPLLYLDGELAAVADLCWSDSFNAVDKGPGVRLAWEGHPPLQGF